VIQSLKLIAKGRVHRNEVMGPVGTVSVMSTTVEKSSQYGIFNAFLVFLELLSMLSSNLGIMNLLPIPALDGGRLIFILFEMISRRRLPFSIEERINQIGMAALLMLMLVILSNDIWNIISGAYASLLGG
jgi:regulator of sigma E protease